MEGSPRKQWGSSGGLLPDRHPAPAGRGPWSLGGTAESREELVGERRQPLGLRACRVAWGPQGPLLASGARIGAGGQGPLHPRPHAFGAPCPARSMAWAGAKLWGLAGDSASGDFNLYYQLSSFYGFLSSGLFWARSLRLSTLCVVCVCVCVCTPGCACVQCGSRTWESFWTHMMPPPPLLQAPWGRAVRKRAAVASCSPQTPCQ